MFAKQTPVKRSKNKLVGSSALFLYAKFFTKTNYNKTYLTFCTRLASWSNLALTACKGTSKAINI